MPGIDIAWLFGLKPEEAIAYLQAKGFAITWDWHEQLAEAHTRAFTVAKVMREDILADIRAQVQQGLDEGISFGQFKKELTPKLKTKGWWGEVVNEQTGEVAVVGPHRLRTIFDTNIQTAYQVGHYRQNLENVDDRSWWMYSAVMDKRTRPAHAALNGLVFRHDDPFWDTHHPPNGFRCRCAVRALTGDQLTAREAAGTAARRSTLDGSATLDTVDKPLTRAGDLVPVTTVKTRDLTGAAAAMAPDPGWNYNPGAAWPAWPGAEQP